MSTKKKSKRDYTKYEFEGEQYGKAKLVHAVVQKYVAEHPKATSKDLKLAFPRKEMRLVYEVIETVNKATPGRFFLKSDDLIKAFGRKVAVTNQWGINSLGVFIDYVNKNLKYQIKAVA